MVRLKNLGTIIPVADIGVVPAAPKTADPIYSTPEYRKWQAAVIARANGRCQDPECKMPHRTGIRLFADHIKELKDGGAPFDPKNGMARCGSCHTRKTNDERAKRMSRPTSPA